MAENLFPPLPLLLLLLLGYPPRELPSRRGGLKEKGLLCKETHNWIIRFAPPLVITKDEIDLALGKIKEVLG